MKRLFFIISALSTLALGLSSCKGDVMEAPVRGISIKVTDVQDSSFTFTLAPDIEAMYYAYMIDKGEAYGVTPDEVYKFDGKGFQFGQFKYKDETSATVEVKNLMPNTLYTIYAVPSSKYGDIGNVYTASVTTTDKVCPTVKSFSSDGNKLTIEFDEDVVAAEAKPIVAVPYCKMFLTGAPAGNSVEGTIKGVNGNKVTVEFTDITMPGTYYLVNYGAGTFTDNAGNSCSAVSSAFTSAVVEKDGSASCTGIYGFIRNAELVTVLPSDKTIKASAYASFWTTVGIPAGTDRVDLVDTYFTAVEHSDGSVNTYSMSKITNIMGDYYSVWVHPAGTVIVGDKVSIHIPAGALRDWYGNINSKEIVVGPLEIIAD